MQCWISVPVRRTSAFLTTWDRSPIRPATSASIIRTTRKWWRLVRDCRKCSMGWIRATRIVVILVHFFDFVGLASNLMIVIIINWVVYVWRLRPAGFSLCPGFRYGVLVPFLCGFDVDTFRWFIMLMVEIGYLFWLGLYFYYLHTLILGFKI